MPEHESTTDPMSAQPSPALLVAKGVALVALVAAITFALFLFVPEETDNFDVMKRKYDRLTSIPSPRIVLIGGSNLAFGIDSDALRETTGCEVVNLGFNGYLGVRYLLAEALPHVGRGDVVVFAFEYDNYAKSVDGSPDNLLMAVKTRPGALAALTWPQRAEVARTVPYAVQQKLLRIMHQGVHRSMAALRPSAREGNDEVETADEAIAKIERLSSYSPTGDLVAHLDVRWEHGIDDGLDLRKLPIDQTFIPLIRESARVARERGAVPIYSFPASMRSYFLRNRVAIDSVYDVLRQAREFELPSPPSRYVFDDSLFFDTVYHLNRAGRAERTRRLADDILRASGRQRTCAPSAPPTLHTP